VFLLLSGTRGVLKKIVGVINRKEQGNLVQSNSKVHFMLPFVLFLDAASVLFKLTFLNIGNNYYQIKEINMSRKGRQMSKKKQNIVI